ncbi:MAG: sugar transferase [Xanthobacteraceae bacterium]|jgi:exopolysaccharide production protein ExoY
MTDAAPFFDHGDISSPARVSRGKFSPRAVPLGGAPKRLLDATVALGGLILLFPLMLCCALVVALTSPGPVMFRHRRIGFAGRPFYCLKFRTMVVDAEARLREHLARNPDARQEWETSHKLQNDPRITPLGQLLRKTSLDELPQLINVLRGEMSMVGPRPIVDGEVEKYREEFALYVSSRPGLTGLWQVMGRNSTTYAERVAYDVAYLRDWSLANDVRIIIRTIPHVLGSDSAY